jgi:hypothetical protein
MPERNSELREIILARSTSLATGDHSETSGVHRHHVLERSFEWAPCSPLLPWCPTV